MDLTIQVERVAATVVDRKGRSSEVVFFLHTVSPHLFATETVADRLNDPETRFLPCEIDGRTFAGQAVSTDVMEASAVAYLRAVDASRRATEGERVAAGGV